MEYKRLIKSTTGRSENNIDWRLPFAASISPSLAELWALHLFSRPRKLPRPDAEHVLLASGRPFRAGRLAAWAFGSGPPIVLAHGWEGRGAQLGAFIAPLVQKGFSVILFDALAHGASPGFHATLSDFADGLFAVQKRVGPPAAIIAHSFGALGALLAVRRGLDPKALVLIGTPSPAKRVEWFQNAFALSDTLTSGLVTRIERAVGVPMTGVEGAELSRDLAIPGLLIHDREDREAPFSISAEMRRGWAASRLLLTEGLGHRRILRDPAVIADVATFITHHAPIPAQSPQIDRLSPPPLLPALAFAR